MKFLEVAICLAVLQGCGSVINDTGRERPMPTDGVPAPIPPSTGPVPAEGWSGAWTLFPSEAGIVDLTTIGDDALLSVVATTGVLDIGDGPIATDGPSDIDAAAILRVSASGEVVWWQPARYGARLAVDDDLRVYVGEPGRIRILDEHGSETKVHNLGASVLVDALEPLRDGGALLGLSVSGSDFEIAGVSPDTETPFAALVRVAPDGELSTSALATNEVGSQVGFVGVGELAGANLAVTAGAITWQSSAGSETRSGGFVAAAFDPSNSLVSSSTIESSGDSAEVTALPSGEWLFSSGLFGALTVNGEVLSYGGEGYISHGVLLRFRGDGSLSSLVSFGEGARTVSDGAAEMVAVARAQVAPLELLWCETGAPPCDEYRLADTETFNNLLATVDDGGAVYMAGNFRATPGGDQSAPFQLYLMRIEH